MKFIAWQEPGFKFVSDTDALADTQAMTRAEFINYLAGTQDETRAAWLSYPCRI
jgi:hypothetical protein